jgi:disulfide bond formation protein DsbB
VAAMLICFFLALIDNGKYVKQTVYTGANALFAIMGLAIAGRHLWIQNHPSLTCSIGPSSNSFIHFITHAFAGSSDCTIKSWEFMGLSIPEQTLVLFGGLLALLIVQLYYCLKSH